MVAVVAVVVVAVVVVVVVVMVVAVKTNAAERKETGHRIHEGDTHGEDTRTKSKDAITGIDMNLKGNPRSPNNRERNRTGKKLHHHFE